MMFATDVEFMSAASQIDDIVRFDIGPYQGYLAASKP